ncbi:MAG: transglutaminase domain-containing protein [Agathobacter sp.]|nr:transglutaminase domain-containing protein [Agathobacter sp.]
MKKQIVAGILIFTLCISSCITGCDKNSKETGAGQENPVKVNTESQKQVEQENNTERPVPEENKDWYKFNPVVKSPFYEKIIGKSAMKTYENMVDAVMNYRDEFKVEKGVNWWSLGEIISYIFPQYYYVIEEVEQKDGTGHIKYLKDEASTREILSSFGEKVEWWINSCTQESEPDMLKSMEIYQKMAKEVEYNYDAIDPEKEAEQDVSPYNAIMHLNGICQSFGSAYAYLLMQIGIDACPAGGLAEDNTAHEWTLLKLDDKWFYADPTFENGTDSKRLYYFGMTTQRRYEEGSYVEKYINVGNCNQVWGKDVEVNDDRFAQLMDIYDVKKMYADESYVYVEGLDFNNKMTTVKIKY